MLLFIYDKKKYKDKKKNAGRKGGVEKIIGKLKKKKKRLLLFPVFPTSS